MFTSLMFLIQFLYIPDNNVYQNSLYRVILVLLITILFIYMISKHLFLFLNSYFQKINVFIICL